MTAAERGPARAPDAGRRSSALRRRKRRVLTVAAAFAGLMTTVTGCSPASTPQVVGRPVTVEPTRTPTPAPPPTPAPTPPGPTAMAPTTRAAEQPADSRDVRAWAAALPVGAGLEIPMVSGHAGHEVLSYRATSAALPADVADIAAWASTAGGTVVLLHSQSYDDSAADQYAFLVRLRPDGRLEVIHHGPISAMAADPDGSTLAWDTGPGLSLRDTDTVVVDDPVTRRIQTSRRFPATSSLIGWSPAGYLVATDTAHGRLTVLTPTGGVRTRTAPVLTDAGPYSGDRVVVAATHGCPLLDLRDGRRSAALPCPPSPVLGPGQLWMVAGNVPYRLPALTPAAPLVPVPSSPQAWRFQDATHVLTVIDHPGQSATAPSAITVRCDLPTGSCERTPPITRPRPAPRSRASSAPRCTDAALTVQPGFTGVAMSHWEHRVVLTNTSTATCTMRGYPTLRFLDGHGRPVPVQITHEQGYLLQAHPPQTVVLAPEASASFSLAGTNELSGSCDAFPTLEATLPGSSLRRPLGAGGTICREQLIHVVPVTALNSP